MDTTKGLTEYVLHAFSFRMAYKRCHTIGDAAGLGVTFVIVCHRCYRVRRVGASVLLFGLRHKARLHRETPIDDLQGRVVCTGDGDTSGCGHRGGSIFMTLSWSPQLTDRQYVTRCLEKLSTPKRSRRWP